MAAQTDSEVRTVSLGTPRNTLGRWGFYERIKFRCEYKGVGGKWDFRIKVGTAETWDMSLTSFWPIQDTKQENINILENNLAFD